MKKEESFNLINLSRYNIESILSALQDSKENMQEDLVRSDIQEEKDDLVLEDIEFLTNEIKAIEDLQKEIQQQTNITFIGKIT